MAEKTIPGIGADDTAVLIAPEFLGVVKLVGAEQTESLPPASTMKNKFLVFKCTAGSVTITIDGYGAETIDGQTTTTLDEIYQTVTLWCDGASWYIV